MEAVFPIFMAERQNWGLIGPGAWDTMTWTINNDGSYRIHTEYKAEDTEMDFYDDYGQLSEQQMKSFYAVIRGKWRNTDIECRGCDGEAWKMRRYSLAGNLVNSSGKLGYIYGHEKLEKIAEYLLGIKHEEEI